MEAGESGVGSRLNNIRADAVTANLLRMSPRRSMQPANSEVGRVLKEPWWCIFNCHSERRAAESKNLSNHQIRDVSIRSARTRNASASTRDTACARVRPYAIAPGIYGISAIQRPSFSLSISTANRMTREEPAKSDENSNFF
jgi:hypothetical protein